MYTNKKITFIRRLRGMHRFVFNLNLRYLRNLRMKIYRWNFWHILI